MGSQASKPGSAISNRSNLNQEKENNSTSLTNSNFLSKGINPIEFRFSDASDCNEYFL